MVTGAGGPWLRRLSYKYNPTIFADSASSKGQVLNTLVEAESAKMVGLYL